MKKEKYDLIFSVGATCACSQVLRAAGLQYASFPYDWTYCLDLEHKIKRLCAGLTDLFEPDKLRILNDPGLNNLPCWTDADWFRWPHDLRVGVPLEEQLPGVRQKYVRRIERLFRLLDSSRRTLVVYVDNKLQPTPSADAMNRLRQLLAERWPKAGIEILFVRNAAGVKPEQARLTKLEGCRIIDVDCCSCDGPGGAEGLYDRLGKYLASLYEVVDYRTPEEKREGPRKRRLAKYGKFAATTFWGYHWNRLQHKLYRHLLKRMQKRGLA